MDSVAPDQSPPVMSVRFGVAREGVMLVTKGVSRGLVTSASPDMHVGSFGLSFGGKQTCSEIVWNLGRFNLMYKVGC